MPQRLNLVPTVPVGMPSSTLRVVPSDAERPPMHSDAERRNEGSRGGRIILGITMVLILTFAVPSLAHPATKPAGDESAMVEVPTPSPKALQYYRSGNRLWAIDELWALAFPAALLFSGASARLRDLSRRIGRSWFGTIGVYVVLYSSLLYAASFPLLYYQGFVRQHAYGLSEQSFGRWFGNMLKMLAISSIAGFFLAWVPYLLLARSSRRWWLYLGLLEVPFLFATMLVTPIWIDPLFNHYGPLKDIRDEQTVIRPVGDLERKIDALAERAGISGGRIFQVDKSLDTRALNAYVIGVLGTKRIVLWDTLIAGLDDAEVLAVMGHEMGHYVLGHVPKTIVLSSAVVLIGLFWADRGGKWLIGKYRDRFGFESLADVASVPLLMLLLQASSLVLAPVANAYSRAQEHEADRFALEITRTNRSAALAFVKLQQTNLGNPRPGAFYTIWRGTHPSIGERIDFCNHYHPWAEGKPVRYGEKFSR